MPVYNRRYIDTQSQKPLPIHLQNAGPRLEVEIQLPRQIIEVLTRRSLQLPNPITGRALIDTGASITAVDGSLVRTLNLAPVGVTEVRTPSGIVNQNVYPVSISFSGIPLPPIPLVLAVGSQLRNQNIVALIGRDILARYVFIYNGPGAIITLSI